MNYLKKLNKHVRDKYIKFKDVGHIYTIKGESDYTSVTTWNHSHFKKFDSDKIIKRMMSSQNWKNSKYYGMTKQEIENQWEENRVSASTAGTKLHYNIECYYNNQIVFDNSKEYGYFMNFVKDNPELKPYRTEWMIWDSDLKLAGSIDMVYENSDGTLMIYDWKRSKEIVTTKKWKEFSQTVCIGHIEDTNFWHYSLQLNTYKAIIEKNYGKKVTNMRLVCLHPVHDNYIVYDVPDLSKEISDLFALRIEHLNSQK